MKEGSERFEFPPRSAALWGLSMGGAFATKVAALDPDARDGLVVVMTHSPVAKSDGLRYREGATEACS